MLEFTAVLPVRDTELECEMLTDSLASCLQLEPSEVLLCLDAPSRRITQRAERVADFFNYHGLRFLIVPPSPGWNFQLAKIVWTAYTEARNDIILSFDVDTVLFKKPLLRGFDIIRNDDRIGLVSFRKFLRTRTLPDYLRMFAYSTLYLHRPFAGLYFLRKQAYFRTLSESRVRQLRNGVDTLISQELWKQAKYRVVCLLDFGCLCMTCQNEDYPWRQLATGIWLAAHYRGPDLWFRIGLRLPRLVRFNRGHEKRRRTPLATLLGLPSKVVPFMICHLGGDALVQGILMARPIIFKGFMLGLANRNHRIVKQAMSYADYNEYSYMGKSVLEALPCSV